MEILLQLATIRDILFCKREFLVCQVLLGIGEEGAFVHACLDVGKGHIVAASLHYLLQFLDIGGIVAGCTQQEHPILDAQFG